MNSPDLLPTKKIEISQKTYYVVELNKNNLKRIDTDNSSDPKFMNYDSDEAELDKKNEKFNCVPSLKKDVADEYTHFISIPLCTPALKDKIFALLLDIKENSLTNINIDELAVDLDKLHITLIMLKLSDSNKIRQCIEILQKNENAIQDILCDNQLEIKGLNYFGKNVNNPNELQARVLYANFENNKCLLSVMKVVDFLTKKFIKEKLIAEKDLSSIKYVSEKDCYEHSQLHLTILKGKEKHFDASKILKNYGGMNLGFIKADRVELSAKKESEDSGYYRNLYRIKMK